MLQQALCELNQLPHVFASVAIAQVFYCSGAVYYRGHYFVSMFDGGSGEIFVIEMDGFYEMFAVGGFYVASMCLVVFW